MERVDYLNKKHALNYIGVYSINYEGKFCSPIYSTLFDNEISEQVSFKTILN